MMKNLIYPVFGVMILLLLQACHDNHGKNYNKATGADTSGASFILDVIKGGSTEIRASGLVITSSNNQKVIGLAKMIIEDHSKAGDDLKKIAGDKQVNVKDTIDAAHQQMINELSKKSGAAFDKAYLQMMVTDHEQAVKLFSAAVQNDNSDIKSFAAKTLPTIKTHLDSARAILTALK